MLVLNRGLSSQPVNGPQVATELSKFTIWLIETLYQARTVHRFRNLLWIWSYRFQIYVTLSLHQEIKALAGFFRWDSAVT